MADDDFPLLLHRIDRKLGLGRGINLSRGELEALVRSGAYAALAATVARQVERRVEAEHGLPVA